MATNCSCGAADCWADGDYTWLDEKAGWCGVVHGCQVAIYWIHGKKIAEERHIGEFNLSLSDLHARLDEWCSGLENPVINWSHDTGGEDLGLWIRDVREPTGSDWQRLREAREQQLARDRRDLAWMQKRIEANQASGAVDPQVVGTGKPPTRA